MINTFSSDKRKIQKYCKQWHRDSKDHAQPWPKGGTFDEDIVEHTLTYIRSKYQKKKRKKWEAILSLWRVFCETKANVKVTETKEAATQEQEKPPEQAPEEPPPYGIYPTLPAAGYQDPEQVEPNRDRTDVKGAWRAPRPVPSAPWVDHEQKSRDRVTSKSQHTGEQVERSRNLDPLQGQWTTGQIILKLGNISAETLREAAWEWMQEEREMEKEMERSQYDKRLDEMGGGRSER
ncbi:hypothetical protein NDU88_002062 [Pleurodeles waltl]|uniref:Uncharacterized protein n=1 Tax=Pleurodeles waltl TaxID=8319 RepID=A0AAV7VY98_PLEWA|nr:hypothetical protein NDU88_002062 [Pleurodeles waltl]